MFDSRNLNNKINSIHEKALKIVYQNNLGFSEVFNLNISPIENHKKKQVLLTEIYKVKNGIAPEKLKDILEFQNSFYNLRSSSNQFRRKNKNTAHYD